MEDCIFIPASASQPLRLSQGGAVTAPRCRLGTLDTRLDLWTDNAVATVNDSFLNVHVDGNRQVAFEGCYGRLTTRQRSGGNISISHCVLVGGATGANSVLYRNFDGGSRATGTSSTACSRATARRSGTTSGRRTRVFRDGGEHGHLLLPAWQLGEHRRRHRGHHGGRVHGRHHDRSARSGPPTATSRTTMPWRRTAHASGRDRMAAT
jgi:hypothetical protein